MREKNCARSLVVSDGTPSSTCNTCIRHDGHCIQQDVISVWIRASYLRPTMIVWMVLSIIFIPLTESFKHEKNRSHIIVAYRTLNLTFYCYSNDTEKEFKVSLIKGINKEKTVCKGSFNSSHQPFQHQNCRITPTEHTITLYLWGLTENDTDIYFFVREEMYPPPYTIKTDNGTIIHVKEVVSTPVIQESQQSLLPMLATVICLAVYSTCISAALIYFVRKGKKTRILQSEYINVVPRRPKHHQPYAPPPMHSRVR
ncbi:T-cell-specific surface glycoprotein CD28 [Pelodytes ibericus]